MKIEYVFDLIIFISLIINIRFSIYDSNFSAIAGWFVALCFFVGMICKTKQERTPPKRWKI